MTTVIGIKDILAPESERKKLKEMANYYPSWQLKDRQICDLGLLLNCGFSPLIGFMGIANYKSVLEHMRLEDGSLWPMPITLDVTDEFVDKIQGEQKITLRDKEGFALAILTISAIPLVLWYSDTLSNHSVSITISCGLYIVPIIFFPYFELFLNYHKYLY